MKLSILIATLGWRKKQLSDLLAVLMPQVDASSGIEVIAYWNVGEKSIGEIRQALLKEATGEYVCFVDDDDMVPPYYCQEILKHLGEDYVGFQVKLFSDGTEKPPVYHSLRYTGWSNDWEGYYRNVTHLNPIRRELALQGDFSESQGMGEDEQWANKVMPLVKTENYIDKVMYYYYHSSKDSSFVAHPKRSDKYHRLAVASKNFRYHPDNLIKEGQ